MGENLRGSHRMTGKSEEQFSDKAGRSDIIEHFQQHIKSTKIYTYTRSHGVDAASLKNIYSSTSLRNNSTVTRDVIFGSTGIACLLLWVWTVTTNVTLPYEGKCPSQNKI